MITITTHVLDTALGRPAVGLAVVLERAEPDTQPVKVGDGLTDADGRIRNMLAPGTQLEKGTYRLQFATGAYFARDGRESFYPVVIVIFAIAGGDAHYHVPLLLSPYGYSTYRGS